MHGVARRVREGRGRGRRGPEVKGIGRKMEGRTLKMLEEKRADKTFLLAKRNIYQGSGTKGKVFCFHGNISNKHI